MPDPLVVSVMREFKDALRLREQGQMAQMAARYLDIEQRLTTQMELLAGDMAARKAQGLAVSEGALYRMDRYKALQAQVKAEYNRYAIGYAQPLIETEQRYYGEMGIMGAWNSLAVQAGSAGINVAWNRLPIEAIQGMVGLAGDGSPLKALLAKGYPDAMDGMLKALINGTALGWNPRKTARAMGDGLAYGLDRCLTIARTEQLRVFRAASTAQYRESGIVKGFKRLVTKDERTCLACLASDGETFETADELEDHPNGRCLVPESIVAGPAAIAFVSRYYKGDVVTIRLTSGQFVTVTPNHPILTDRGWVAAQFVQKGDNVVCSGFLNRTPAGMGPDEYQVPTLIEQIPRALSMNRLSSVPATAKDFHGDGRGSDVYVVWANSLLRDGFLAPLSKPAHEQEFGLRNIARLALPGLRAALQLGVRVAHTAHGILGDLDTALMLLLGRLFGQESVGLGLVTAGHAAEFQVGSYGRSGYAKGLGEGVFGFASQVAKDHGIPGPRRLAAQRGNHLISGDSPAFGQRTEQPASLEYIREALARDAIAAGAHLGAITGDVGLDSVFDVGVTRFVGHVYNLQTSIGWYNASSSISQNSRCANMPIVHNCAAVPLLNVGPAVQWENAAQWFGGLDPETQERMMGAERYDAWRGHRISFEDLRRTAHSDTWGDSPRLATLQELGIA